MVCLKKRIRAACQITEDSTDLNSAEDSGDLATMSDDASDEDVNLLCSSRQLEGRDSLVQQQDAARRAKPSVPDKLVQPKKKSLPNSTQLPTYETMFDEACDMGPSSEGAARVSDASPHEHTVESRDHCLRPASFFLTLEAGVYAKMQRRLGSASPTKHALLFQLFQQVIP